MPACRHDSTSQQQHNHETTSQQAQRNNSETDTSSPLATTISYRANLPPTQSKYNSPTMNTTFNSALKQRTTIRKDLSALTSQQSQPLLTPATLGSLSASLTAFARTIDEYNALAKQELNRAKQEKALERIRDFRAELAEFRATVETLKAARDEAAHAENRAELLGRRPFAAGTPENPYAGSIGGGGLSNNNNTTGGGAGMGTGAGYGYGGGSGHARTTSTAEAGTSVMGSEDVTREGHALREQQFFASTHSALDEYIARGQAVLGDLGQQREMLKSTQRRLYSVGNTLGISGDTIRMVERRAKEDKWVFGGGVVVFFVFCWLVLHYLR
ncbi:V-snare-domain-containing protein [Parathielavia hyrcaniae]|uniref:V-snare-domain-containing protein n=1 Tax=Parathielavia hyrcaniae TaxID=113614 RepID=A0AAN6SZ45_9PEZI|nr:V-snare-domain-containing protein [Parathielavia hyrcaniae]